MLSPVVIRFTEAGLPDIDRAFATIEQKILQLEKNATRGAEAGSQARIRAAKQEAEGRERAATGAAKSEEKRETERTRATERQERYLEGVRRRSAEMAGRLAAQQAREEEREAQRSARAIERLEEEKTRVRIRSSEMAGRLAEQEARAEERARSRISRGIGHAATGGLGRAAGTAASLAGGALAIGGGFAIADIAGREMAAQRTAALLVNAVTTGGAPPPGANVGSILSQASALSRETGMGKEDLIAGTLEYSRKARGGDFAGAMANMGFFARMAKTTGTDINEIAAAAGTLQSQNPDLKAPEMQQMLLDVYAQGKAGSMSMIDVAKQIGILSSTRSSFAGNAADNQRKLLALGQLAAPEGTVEEAGTFIKNFVAEAGGNRKSTREKVGLEQMGVKFDKFGQMESPEQMIESVFRGTGGDITKIEKIFGLRGTALFRSLQPAFVGAGGGEAGIQAVRAKMASVTGATMSAGDLDAQFQQMMSTPAEKIHRAFNDLSEVVAARVEPVLSQLADTLTREGPALERFLTGVMDVADFLIANPWEGIGAAVALAITKNIAEAALGEVVAKALTTRIGTGGGIIATSAAVTVMGMAVIDLLAGMDVRDQKNKVSGQLEAQNTIDRVMTDVRGGRVNARDVSDLQNALSQQQASKEKLENAFNGMPIAGGGGLNLGKIAGALGLDEGRHRAELESTTRSIKDLQKAIQVASSGLASLGATASNTHPDHPNRSQTIDKRSP